MPRVIVLGCGTGVGKTRVSSALLRALVDARQSCIGLKPIESGLTAHDESVFGSDAYALARAGSVVTTSSPLYALASPVSPHLAARAECVVIKIEEVVSWVKRQEGLMTPLVSSDMVKWTIVEGAGGAFSPVSNALTNFDLARALEPAQWILVAADALGVLHDVTVTLAAMRARGRAPDHLVLSAARTPDASTGTNARELDALGIASPSAVLARGDDRGIQSLVAKLLRGARSS
jgi:dethiobiotin synthetase